jgi:calcineurin-like phosphoesterase family protein
VPRIVVTSDLHYGITGVDQLRALADAIASEMPDLTVLAGDIGEGMAHFTGCLRVFGDLPGTVGVMAGNHDLWARDHRDSQELWERALPETVREAGMLWLDDDLWHYDGLAVTGSIGWYDYSAVDPFLPPYPREYFARHKGDTNADAWYVTWPWSDAEFAARVGDALVARLQAVEDDPAAAGALVVTHVPLTEAQMCRRPDDRRWGTSNAYFGNLTLGQRVLAFPKLRAIVSGHTHIGREGLAKRTSPAAGDDLVPVSVVPSDYGRPAYLVLDVTGNALHASLCRPEAPLREQVGSTVRRGLAAGEHAAQLVRTKLWKS